MKKLTMAEAANALFNEGKKICTSSNNIHEYYYYNEESDQIYNEKDEACIITIKPYHIYYLYEEPNCFVVTDVDTENDTVTIEAEGWKDPFGDAISNSFIDIKTDPYIPKGIFYMTHTPLSCSFREIDWIGYGASGETFQIKNLDTIQQEFQDTYDDLMGKVEKSIEEMGKINESFEPECTCSIKELTSIGHNKQCQWSKGDKS